MDEKDEGEKDKGLGVSRIIKLFDVVWTNGFGFQCSGVLPRGSLVVAFLYRDDGKEAINETKWTAKFCADLKVEANCLKIDDFLGKTYLQVHWTLYQRIPEILQYTLDEGFSLTLQNKLDMHYKAGSRFDPRKLESRWIARFRELLQQFHQRPGMNDPDPWRTAYLCTMSCRWSILCDFNWQTQEGKAFAKELRSHVGDPDNDNDNTTLNYFLWKEVDATAKKYRLLQYADWWWVKQEDNKKEEDKEKEILPPPPQICVICQDRTANTFVLPCEHQVCCTICSEHSRI